MVCTFFGHRDIPDNVRPVLKITLEKLIINGTKLFYVGNQGKFDKMVLEELQLIRKQYTNIKYFVVLAYPEHHLDSNITLYPEGMECVPPKFAIDRRNRWMLKQSDTVITYIMHPGGAEKHKNIAVKQGKKIIDLI